jgi:hypothetical protein
MEIEVHGACLSGGIRKMIANGVDVNDGRTLHWKVSGRRSVRGARAGRECNGYSSAVLPVTGAAASGLHYVSAGGAFFENLWLSGFDVSGYLSQTFGMWQNSSALKDFTASRNNLAVSCTLPQVDENFRLNESNNFFMREWFVYEPPCAWDGTNIKNHSNVKPASYGHFMNDWYNIYQVRKAWWENKTASMTTYVGNQIVVWAKAIAFRIGDVIDPTDTTWAFGFSNLEQSRNPQ